MSHDTPHGIEDAGMALDELWKRHGHQLPSENVTKLLGEIVMGLERLPYHVTLDDGAFRPPYKNAALRAEAEWHRIALQSLTRRLADGA